MTSSTESSYSFNPIGVIRSPYTEKFAVPRQPGLVTAAKATLELYGDCNREEILQGIDQFSHLWLTFVFHEVASEGWKPTVRPPRLGGNQRLGVFATRSPYRPNPLGLSVVKLEHIEQVTRKGGKQWRLHLSGIDLVDGTPILDIKPYVPYADSISDATSGFASAAPSTPRSVSFNNKASARLAELSSQYPELEKLICQVIAQQPQPAYLKPSEKDSIRDRVFGMTLYNLNIRWVSTSNDYEVIDIEIV